jgi:hypothetical protein
VSDGKSNFDQSIVTFHGFRIPHVHAENDSI